MKRLNGWQRIGVSLSVLWCLWVVANASYEYYKAASSYAFMVECCAKAKVKPSEYKEGNAISICEIEGFCPRELTRPTIPQLLPLLALLFLPIAAGWLVIYVVLWATKWIRDGFNN